MAEWFVGPVMDKIISDCLEYMKDQVIGQPSTKEALEKLQKLHPMIQSVVYASSQAQIRDQNPALDRWLWQLRDAVDEADDLLDEFEYMKHKEQLTKNTQESKKRKERSTTSLLIENTFKLFKLGESALRIDPNLKRLEEVVQKLVDVSAKVSTFLHLLESTKQEQLMKQRELYKIRETGSLPKDDLIGRGKEIEFVMQWLRKPSSEHQITLYSNISLLSIVGHGGMGKTTLLQHVYEDTRTNEFDLKMWVCVSNNFDTKKVIADMLESLKMYRSSLESLDALQKTLKSEVMSKKFLLVLDDIWEEGEGDKTKWENVLAPLAHGSLGSKILVTTRMDSVALMIAKLIKKKKETLRLEGLGMDECLQLLNSYAFADVENCDDHKKLRIIAREIVKKLSGSPLAAKVIGGVLNSNLDERHWIKVLNSDFGSTELIQNDIFSILRLSYIFLPISLQNCFAFCCIFSQDHKFDKEDLVRMWIALDFIRPPSNSQDNLEDIGGKYFDILVKKSFFDKCQNEYQTYYKMHDLLHELAMFVSAQECFRLVDDKELPISETIRHLSIKTKNLEVLRKMRKLKNLRSLFLFYDAYNNQDFVDVLSEIFEASRSMRLLFVSAPYRMPEAIKNLIHLRYLKFTNYPSAIQLPRSISHLYHLLFIIYHSSEFPNSYPKKLYLLFPHPDDFFPRDMSNIFNLRYIELPPWIKISQMLGIGKLHSLQKCDGFFVKDEAGYRIDELKHMNELQQLSIYQLENVKDAEEAYSAKFCDKRNLAELSLQWGDDEGHRNIVRPDLDEMVLDSLKPHNRLKQLMINAYMGTRSAIWMNNANFISNLEHIKLDGCLEWQFLPPFGMLPLLKSLYLRNMPKAKNLDYKFCRNDNDCVFPSLELLHIEKLEALEDWFDAATATANYCLFPCLKELCLKDCPNLQALPSPPPKLQKIETVNIRWQDFSWIQDTSNCCKISALIRNDDNFTYYQNGQLIDSSLDIRDPFALLMEPLKNITSIISLGIRMNDKLVSFPIEVEHWFMRVSSSLRSLDLIDLKSLQSLPSFLEGLSSLEELTMDHVPQLQLLPNLSASLKGLYLAELKSLQCLPSSLSTISSLRFLLLRSIPLLESLPDLPSSLETLELEELRSLQCLPSSLSAISSLLFLTLRSIPLLKALPDLPLSLHELSLKELDNLDCLPCCLSSISSLQKIDCYAVPQLRELPNLPPSLKVLSMCRLDNLHYLPSLCSLDQLYICNVPQLRELPDLSLSLIFLHLEQLDNLNYMPSCLSSLSSLKYLTIMNVPLLRELPDIPPFLSKVVIQS